MMCYIFDDQFLRLMVNGRKNGKGQLLEAGDLTFLKREKFGFFSNESTLFAAERSQAAYYSGHALVSPEYSTQSFALAMYCRDREPESICEDVVIRGE